MSLLPQVMQELSAKKKILKGQGKVRELYNEPGEIDTFEKIQGKLKL